MTSLDALNDRLASEASRFGQNRLLPLAPSALAVLLLGTGEAHAEALQAVAAHPHPADMTCQLLTAAARDFNYLDGHLEPLTRLLTDRPSQELDRANPPADTPHGNNMSDHTELVIPTGAAVDIDTPESESPSVTVHDDRYVISGMGLGAPLRYRNLDVQFMERQPQTIHSLTELYRTVGDEPLKAWVDLHDGTGLRYLVTVEKMRGYVRHTIHGATL